MYWLSKIKQSIRFLMEKSYYFFKKCKELTDYLKKYFKLKVLRFQFPTKNSVSAHVCPPTEWSYGARKIAVFEILQCTEMGK